MDPNQDEPLDVEAPESFTQGGPDLFGTEPEELLLDHEPPGDGLSLAGVELDDAVLDYTRDPDGGEAGVNDGDDLEDDGDAGDPEDDSDADDLPAMPVITEADVVEGLPETPTAVVAAADDAETDRLRAPLALYRRYRPDIFADVIGQEHVTEPLQRALVNNRVNHAYLFSGPRGCGKTTSARILARCLNCEKGPTPVPCGSCRSCLDLARGGAGSIDVIEIDAASHGGVDEARDLRERAFFAPMQSRYKIYIIDEAHMVTPQGFNALLKVVEEPPPHVKFIFATTEPEKVIGTIRSRTHHYPFRLVPPKTLGAYLASLCASEGAKVESAVLPLVVRAGAGSVRDSLSVLDQLLGGAGPEGVGYAQATKLLGYTPDALLDELVDAFAAGDGQGVFACIDKVIEVGQDPRRFAEDLLRRLRDLIIVAAVPDALTSGLVDVAADQGERLTNQAQSLGSGELTRAAGVIATGLTEMRGTTAPRLHLELMCARVLLPGADVDGRGVHARLDRLERRLQMGEGVGSSPAPSPEAAPARQPVPPTPQPARQPVPPTREPEPVQQSVPPTREPEPAAATPERTPQPSAQPEPPAPTPERPPAGGLSTTELRRLWPDVLDEVKNRRRFTWILLSQNAHVIDLRDGRLTIGMANAGARDSFGRGGSSDILREAILAIVGTAVTIEAVVDPSDGTGAGAAPRASEPTATPADRPASPASPTGHAAADEPSRDDASVEESESSTELLTKHLGAELIGEEDE